MTYRSYHYTKGRFSPGHLQALPEVQVGVLEHSQNLVPNWLGALVIGFGAIVGSLAIAGTSALRVQSNIAPTAAPIAITQQSVETPEPTTTEAPVVEPSEPTTEDLQALVNKWQADYKGGTFGVVIQELDGEKRSASLRPNTQFAAASLYKLYLAHYLYTKIEKGVYSLSSTIGSSRTLGTCLNRMIVLSDNACGESIGYGVGWLTLQNFARSAGFTKTTLTGATQTTANDMANYLEKLQNGSLIRSDFRADLLGYMKKQIYRSAIPAGIPSAGVADKVGFLGSAWNDAAIVYHPKGTYVMVVLSKNAGTAPIKELSERVADFFNR